jgi:polysaccharide biosynthesis/export protein
MRLKQITRLTRSGPLLSGHTVKNLMLKFFSLIWIGFASITLSHAQSTSQNFPQGSPLSPSADGTPGSQTPNATLAPLIPQSEPIEAADIEGKSEKSISDDGVVSIRRVDPAVTARIKPALPSEFEIYLERSLGRKLPRFGANLLLPSNRDFAVPATATVPPDYVLNVGDMVSIALIGSIEGSVDLEINTDGKVFLPKVGAIMLAGVRYRDLKDVVSNAVGRQYRGYTVTVGIKQLRGIRVYVTGFANNPGAYSVNSLSTMVNAVFAAGGPASGGSLRSVSLIRNGQLISNFDLYDLILSGNRTNDVVLQNEDVLTIAPLGKQVAIIGSVNNEAVFEIKPGESIDTLLGYAGGVGVLADASRLILYRLSDRDNAIGREVRRGDARTLLAEGGDIAQILSEGSVQQPTQRQSVVVRLEGEVARPGNYFVAPGTSLSSVITQAGGLTPQAFPFGTRVERLSVRLQQRESFLEAVSQFEISLAASPLTENRANPGNASAQLIAAKAVIDRLRQTEPDGRVVLDIVSNASSVSVDFALENNDRILIPPRPSTVGVFGAVYRPASFLISDNNPLLIRDYLRKAGGPIRAADKRALFVVRANGEVLSRRDKALGARALPGDVIFMPVKTQSSSLFAKVRDIVTSVFQLGLGAAAFIAVTN